MTHWWFPLRSFSALSDKRFWQKIVILPPPLILIFFRDQKFSEAQIRRVSLRNFSALWDKIFDTKSWHNSLKPKSFRNPKLMTHWWVPLRSFSALSDKKFWQKIVISPPPHPPLILIFFRDQKFSEARIRKVSLRNFSALWDKIFDTRSWHNSLKPKIFRNPKLMTHWWVPLRRFSALSDKKFWQKIVIFPPPPLLSLSFFETRNFQKHRSERFLYEIFRHCETNFSTQNRDITLWSLKSFHTRNLWHTEEFPYEVFRHRQTKSFDRKSWYFPPPLILIFFRDQKFSEAQIRKVSLRNFCALWDKIFDTKSWHNSLKPKIFLNPKLMTHWWVPLRSFSALSGRKFWQKIVLFPPPPLILIFFRDQKFSEAQIRKVSLRNFSALWDKIFDTKSWHNSLKPKIFRYPKLMTHWWVPLRSFSALSDKKFWQKIVIFPPLLSLSFFETRKFQKHRSERFLYEIFRHCETKFSTKIVT